MMNRNNNMKVFKTILGIIGGFFAAHAAGTAYLTHSASKEMKENENGNNMLYSFALCKRELEINPETDRAYINCMSSAVELKLNSLPVHYDLYITLNSFASVYAIKLPEGIRVSVEGTGNHVVVNNHLDKEVDECLPTVHILINKARYTVVNIVS